MKDFVACSFSTSSEMLYSSFCNFCSSARGLWVGVDEGITKVEGVIVSQLRCVFAVLKKCSYWSLLGAAVEV
jgi:hypothetical protein